MRIESVTIKAFGPLADVTLDLAPQMTVVVGDNESAKSSWHAAIYAGLCGLGRARGRDSKPVADFIARHRPWDRDDVWEVSAVIALDNGNRIELHQNLATRTNCTAMDLGVGRDIAPRILTDQVPDAAKFVGLDRQSFPATACIYQADLLSVLSHSDALQADLQRAASTSGVKGTAAEALDLLERFYAERVGGDDLRSRNRPLRKAMADVNEARDALGAAEAAHREYLSDVAARDELQAKAQAATRLARLHEAAVAAKRADDLARRYQRAAELAAEFPDGSPEAAGRDEMAEDVAAALSAWHRREAPQDLAGESAAVLQARLGALPPMPAGDLAPDPAVEAADRALQAARHALDQEQRSEPQALNGQLPDVDPEEVMELAHRLTPSASASPAATEEAIAAVDEEIAGRQTATRRADILTAVGAIVVLVGAGAATVGPKGLLGLAALGFVALAVGLATRKGGTLSEARSRRLQLVGQLQAHQEAAAQVTSTRAVATRRCAELGLDPNPDRLRQLAAELHQHDTYGTSRSQWQSRLAARRNEVATAADHLRRTLAERGVGDVTDPMAALEAYQIACTDRRRQAEQAGQRPSLESQLAVRVEAERFVHDRLTQNERAAAEVCRLARALGAGDLDAAAAADALSQWQEELRQQRTQADAVAAKWTELNGLLGGLELEDLAEQASETARTAVELRGEFNLGEVQVLASEDPGVDLPTLRDEAQKAQVAAERSDAAIGSRNVPSVPEAEEALAAAEEELRRIQDLGATLTTTRAFLQAADERVGRTLAPMLANQITAWLPAITAGRYVDASVTPETLEVKVCGANRRWRNAKYLSQGTAEQIHLLLRAALVRYLTAGNDTCPLILDDVTVQADPHRTVAILDLLHQLSSERQVILFAQEPAVADWARDRLMGDKDRVVELEVIPGT